MRDRKRRSVLRRARADGDRMRRPPGHLISGAGREEVLRKGAGEEARSVLEDTRSVLVSCVRMCDVCAAHGDRAAVGVDVDAQGSGFREDETHFPFGDFGDFGVSFVATVAGRYTRQGGVSYLVYNS